MASLVIYFVAIVIVLLSSLSCSDSSFVGNDKQDYQYCASDNPNDSCLFDSNSYRQ